MPDERVKWQEHRGSVVVYCIGEMQPDGSWRMYERECCEIRWYPVEASAEMVARATAIKEGDER